MFRKKPDNQELQPPEEQLFDFWLEYFSDACNEEKSPSTIRTIDEDGNIYYVNYFQCITQWENPGKNLMAWNSFPRKIKEVVLFLHIDHYCGGNNIYIEIVQDGIFCVTQNQNVFRGTSGTWTRYLLLVTT